jgi:hypothetical protein
VQEYTKKWLTANNKCFVVTKVYSYFRCRTLSRQMRNPVCVCECVCEKYSVIFEFILEHRKLSFDIELKMAIRCVMDDHCVLRVVAAENAVALIRSGSAAPQRVELIPPTSPRSESRRTTPYSLGRNDGQCGDAKWTIA